LDTPVTIHAAVSAKQNVKEVVEFYRCIYDELIDTVEEEPALSRSGHGV
jgi:hypothetical protein